MTLGPADARIGQFLECFHTGRKTSGIFLIARLLTSHPARLIQTGDLYKPRFSQNEGALQPQGSYIRERSFSR